MSAERETMIKTLRDEALKDTEMVVSKQRFALFSQPPPLGIGDDSYDMKKQHPRDEQGKPKTDPPNVKVAAPKDGKSKSSYFSMLGFTTIGDQYIDPDRREHQYELEKSKLIKNDAKFKPASGYKEIISAPYPHESDLDPKAPKKKYRQGDGKVFTAPKNVTTNPEAKTLFKYPKHEKDEFERARTLARDQWEASKKLMREQPFKSTVIGGVNFNNDRKAFGLEGSLPPKKPSKEIQLNIMKHEAPFKPSHPPKQGYNGFLQPYPQYKGDPLIPLSRKNLEKTKDAFKPNHGGNLTRPTPSISCYPQNIRREMGMK